MDYNTAFCASCGAQMGATDPFCPACGAPNANAAPQQPTYTAPQQPTYSAPVVDDGKGLGIAGMVVGIVSLVFSCAWYLAIPGGIVGLILSLLAMKKANAVGVKNGMATAGLVCSIIGLAIALIFGIFACVACATASSVASGLDDLDDLYYFMS